MKQATMVCAGVVLLAAAGVSYKLRTSSAPTEKWGTVWFGGGPDDSPYVFKLPVMFFQCLQFPLPKDGETVPGWKFEQSVQMNLGEVRGTINMPGYYSFPSVSSCGKLGGPLGPIHVTFGKDYSITVEEIR